MRNCQNCNTQLLDKSRFCHSCGTDVQLSLIPCQVCSANTPDTSKFCTHCGAATQIVPFQKLEHYKARYPLDFTDIHSLPAQIKSYFFKALRKHLGETKSDAVFNDYVNAFYLSGFNTKFQDKAISLADQCLSIYNKRQPTVEVQLDDFLDDSFAQTMDRFLIYHCQSVTGVAVPKSVTKYEHIQATDINTQQLILDYIGIDKETKTEKFHTDINSVSPIKLKNIQEHFLFSQPQEQLILLYDQTIYGSGREGFAMTDTAIYWKHHFKQAQQVHYPELKIINQQKESLNINNLFFNVDPSLNTKVFLLLKKLKEVYA